MQDTPQKIIQETTGIDGSKSGDGTVPYASLHYPAFWKNIPGLEVSIQEIDSGNSIVTKDIKKK